MTCEGDGDEKDRIKLLAMAGSPRRGGNTDLLLEEAIKGAESQGAEVKHLVLSRLDIAPCRYCDSCRKTGRCIVEDDMQWIHGDLRAADRFILASPIFFMGVTAQAKIVIDRCQPLWVMKYVLRWPVATNKGGERRGAFISVGGRRIKNLFEPAKATVLSFFRTLDIVYAEELLLAGIDERKAILRHPPALREAFLLGQRLAQN